MVKHPELYNAVPYNYQPKTDKNLANIPNRSFFLGAISQEYAETHNTSKIITFDSGQHSDRRLYVEKTLVYLLQVKGIPAVAISCTDSSYTNYYLSKVPDLLRSKVIDLGIYEKYNKIVDHVRNIVDSLYVDIRLRKTIDYFMYALKSLESKLIKQLNAKGILVILDRSLISTFIYNNSLLGHIKDPLFEKSNILSLELLSAFKPYASFFVHSNKGVDITNTSKSPSLFLKKNLYDSFESLNFNIRGIVPLVKEQIPNLVELESHLSFAENMDLIKQALADF